MLVDEYSTSVDTVKKEPPFAKMEAGNVNCTIKQKEVPSIWMKKSITALWELQSFHRLSCTQWRIEKHLLKGKIG